MHGETIKVNVLVSPPQLVLIRKIAINSITFCDVLTTIMEPSFFGSVLVHTGNQYGKVTFYK